MFYTKIINPTTAEIQWQYNCHRNTELNTGTIRVSSAEKLIPAIEKNKAAWVARTLEDYLHSVSRALIREASPDLLAWTGGKKPHMTVASSIQLDEWQDRWRMRRELRTLLTSFIVNPHFQNMVRDLEKRTPDIMALVPKKGLCHDNIKNLATGLCAWITEESAKIKATETVWTQ